MNTLIYNRETKQTYLEKQYKNNELLFLYTTFWGRFLLRLFISNRYFSRILAYPNKAKRSIHKIEPFIKEYSIDPNDYIKKDYKSFNDFFIRKVVEDKRPIDLSEDSLISIADSKLTTYTIDSSLQLDIKGSLYTLSSLLKSSDLAKSYANGMCLIFRLTVDDYHRYCFLDDGNIILQKTINGKLHSVGPISSSKVNVYNENYRKYSLLQTSNFGQVIQVEVGALLVGKIINHDIDSFTKGTEKGYFEFGGSTIILIFKEGTVYIDDDIIQHSRKGIEIKVKYGEKIGGKL